ncbi:MAG: PH domain-containing protein [Opitutae bacterium]|nr:PH domain-containing protein [Opitutae bacterium]
MSDTAQPATLQWTGQMANDVASSSGPATNTKLIATPAALELSGPLGTYRIPREQVVRLHRGQFYPWLFAGFRIRHQAAGLPHNLQFCPNETPSRAVLSALKGLGYPAA